MSDSISNEAKRMRSAYTLAFVNTAIWAIAMIALIFVIQRAPSAKGMFVILAGGSGTSIALLSTLRRDMK